MKPFSKVAAIGSLAALCVFTPGLASAQDECHNGCSGPPHSIFEPLFPYYAIFNYYYYGIVGYLGGTPFDPFSPPPPPQIPPRLPVTL